MPAFFLVVLSRVGRGLAMGRSPVQGDLPKILKVFVASEVNFIMEQARGPNPWNVQEQFQGMDVYGNSLQSGLFSWGELDQHLLYDKYFSTSEELRFWRLFNSLTNQMEQFPPIRRPLSAGVIG